MTNEKMTNGYHEQCMEVTTLSENLLHCIEEGHHVVVVLRGVPGSGKSRLALELAQSAENFEILAEPEKEIEKLMKSVKSALARNVKLIIIDAENLSNMRIKQYARPANNSNYEVYCLEPNTSWKYMAEECAKRSSHGESVESISSKIEQLTNSGKIVGDALFPGKFKTKSWNCDYYDPPSMVPRTSPVMKFQMFKKEAVDRETSPSKGIISLSAPEKKKIEKRNVLCQVSMVDIAQSMAGDEPKADIRAPEVYTVDAQILKPLMLDRSTWTSDSASCPLAKCQGDAELEFLFSIFTPARKMEAILHDYKLYGFEIAYKLSVEERSEMSHDSVSAEFIDFYKKFADKTDSNTEKIGDIFHNDVSFLGRLRQVVKHEVLPGEYADAFEYPSLSGLVESDAAIAMQLQAEEEARLIDELSPKKHTMADIEKLKELKEYFSKFNFSSEFIESTFELEKRSFKITFDTLCQMCHHDDTADEYNERKKESENRPSPFFFSQPTTSKQKIRETNPNPNLQKAQADAGKLRSDLEKRINEFGNASNKNQKLIESIRRQDANQQTSKKFQEIDKIIRDGHSSIYYLDLHGMTADGAVDFVRDAYEQARSGRDIEIITGAGKNSLNPSNNIRSKILKFFRTRNITFTTINDGCYKVRK